MTTWKVDYDGRVPGRLLERVAVVARAHKVRVVGVQMRRTVRGWHMTVDVVGRMSFIRVVLAQALLGSDWKRETFNTRRAMAWRNVPPFWRARANVLYMRHYRGV